MAEGRTPAAFYSPQEQMAPAFEFLSQKLKQFDAECVIIPTSSERIFKSGEYGSTNGSA
jgi:hypothetical protein